MPPTHRTGFPQPCPLCGTTVHTAKSLKLHPCSGRKKMERAMELINNGPYINGNAPRK